MDFNDHNAFAAFAHVIRSESHFGLDPIAQQFLAAFKSQLSRRVVQLPAEQTLFRAARDHIEITEGGEYDIAGCGEERMRPKREFAAEMRANAAGIVHIYLASTPETAVSETRPWVGEYVSVATFIVRQPLRLINLTKGHGKMIFDTLSVDQFLGNEVVPSDVANDYVWMEIDRAFSTPKTKSDTGAEYVPTQLLAEVIRYAGYNGIVYKSVFGGEKGYNLVLFDDNVVKFRASRAMQITSLKLDVSPGGHALTTARA